MTVEVDVSLGIGIHLVGLADAAVRESLLRITTAMQATGFRIPGKKIVINLAPADMQKQGSGYDLPIALGIMAASGQLDSPDIDKYLIMGELGLDASIRPVRAALPAAELAAKMGLKGCIMPVESALEAADCKGTLIYAVRRLEDVLSILGGEDREDRLVRNTEEYACASVRRDARAGQYMDFSEIVGQDRAKRGMEISAAGGHNVALIGAPGSGKSSLAKALCGILPPMTSEEAMMTSKIYSVSGRSRGACGLMHIRPFRSPHCSASLSAIIGGGNGDNIMPGEVSLAQNGVLFLDEFTNLPRNVAEALRAPIEDRKVVVSRLRRKVEYPCSFTLVIAANPCPCGYYGERGLCSCSPSKRISYMSRLSGPIMDRIDIQLWLHPVETSCLVNKIKSEDSSVVAARVAAAREIQRGRFEEEGIFVNAEMNQRQLERYCPLSPECKEMMSAIIDRMGLSARAFSRVIRIARTIADLAGAPDILPLHLTEAASLRLLDRRDPFG